MEKEKNSKKYPKNCQKKTKHYFKWIKLNFIALMISIPPLLMIEFFVNAASLRLNN